MTFFVIGDEDVVLGFKFIGINGAVADTEEEVINEFNRVINDEYGNIGILIISEKASSLIDEKIMEWQLSGKYPLIVEIPDMDGHIEGKKSLLDSIKKAIGLSV